MSSSPSRFTFCSWKNNFFWTSYIPIWIESGKIFQLEGHGTVVLASISRFRDLFTSMGNKQSCESWNTGTSLKSLIALWPACIHILRPLLDSPFPRQLGFKHVISLATELFANMMLQCLKKHMNVFLTLLPTWAFSLLHFFLAMRKGYSDLLTSLKTWEVCRGKSRSFDFVRHAWWTLADSSP